MAFCVLHARLARLRDCLRTTDLFARLGGDEFAVLPPNASTRDAVAIAKRILAAFDLPFHIEEHVVFSSCSIVSADSQFYTEPADLLRDADTAMYRVKNAGRDSFVVFNQELRCQVSDQVEREGALRNAMKLKRDDELLPYFQPIVDVQSGEVVALEALIRWRQQDGTMVPPGEFLPVVEGLRLIGRLDLLYARARCGHSCQRALCALAARARRL